MLVYSASNFEFTPQAIQSANNSKLIRKVQSAINLLLFTASKNSNHYQSYLENKKSDVLTVSLLRTQFIPQSIHSANNSLRRQSNVLYRFKKL